MGTKQRQYVINVEVSVGLLINPARLSALLIQALIHKCWRKKNDNSRNSINPMNPITKKRRYSMDQIISNFLAKLEFGEVHPVRNGTGNPVADQRSIISNGVNIFNNMAVIPLFTSVNGSPQYLTLKEALEKRLLTITEVSQGGSVPELKVVNKAEILVLLLDGEELAGAKQNRVLNTTILLKENSETNIPVSCTEQGRWSYATPAFAESGNIMSHNLRVKKASSVFQTLKGSMSYRGNQGEVWDGIAFCRRAANVNSRTRAMRDVFESKESDLKAYLDAFQYISNQRGIFVMVNGEVAGFDILSLSSAYEMIHQKLVKSYAMDALLQKKKDADKASVDQAKSFIKEATQCEEKRYESIGHGWDHRFEGRTIVGSSLVYQEKVIHMAFFRKDETERVGTISSSSRRRRFRM